MPGTTTNIALPYPSGTDAPDGPGAVYNLAKAIDDMSTAVGTIGFAGTMHDWNTGNGWGTVIRRALGLVAVVANVDPGANGIGTSTGNNLLAALPLGFRPIRQIAVECPIYTGTWAGGRAQIQFNTDGTIVCNYLSTAVVSGNFIAINATFPVA